MGTINYFENPTHTLSASPSILPILLQRVTQLNITLRLPLAFFKSLECLEKVASPEVACPDPELESLVQDWLRLSSSLRCLTNLCTLRFWLDHNKPDFWAVVNERALLSPLSSLFQAQGLNVSFSLPKLHPKLEQEDRHFVQGTPLCFVLHRRVRQRYHGIKSVQGTGEIVRKADVPFLLGIVDFVDMTMAEIEEEERAVWESGLDAEDMVRELLVTPGSIAI